MMNKRIIVLGASGYTGKIICLLLQKDKIKFSIAGRDNEKLITMKEDLSYCTSTVEAQLVDGDDIELLKISNFDIYINCIGPFTVYSKAITKFLSNKNCVYLDITGEQSFLKYSTDELESEIVKNDSLFIHSNSFESSLVMLMANQICEKEQQYESINSFYGFKSGAPSPGTRFTMKTHHYFDQYIVEDDNLQVVSKVPEFKEVKFKGWEVESLGYFTPFPEVLFLNKKYNSKNIASYTLMPRFDAEMTKQMELNSKKGDLDKTIKKLSRSKYQGPSKEERSEHGFFIGVKSIDNDGLEKFIELSGRDMYQLTAVLMVEGLKALLDQISLPTGVLPLSEVVDSKNFLSNLVIKYDLILKTY